MKFSDLIVYAVVFGGTILLCHILFTVTGFNLGLAMSFFVVGNSESLVNMAIPVVVVLTILSVVVVSLTGVPSTDDSVEVVIQAEPAREIKDGTEYAISLFCRNCHNAQEIEVVKGYDVEEALKVGEYHCETCGSKKLERIGE